MCNGYKHKQHQSIENMLATKQTTEAHINSNPKTLEYIFRGRVPQFPLRNQLYMKMYFYNLLGAQVL